MMRKIIVLITCVAIVLLSLRMINQSHPTPQNNTTPSTQATNSNVAAYEKQLDRVNGNNTKGMISDAQYDEQSGATTVYLSNFVSFAPDNLLKTGLYKAWTLINTTYKRYTPMPGNHPFTTVHFKMGSTDIARTSPQGGFEYIGIKR